MRSENIKYKFKKKKVEAILSCSHLNQTNIKAVTVMHCLSQKVLEIAYYYIH